MENTNWIDRLNQLEIGDIETLTWNDAELLEAFEGRSPVGEDAIDYIEVLLGDSVAF